LHLVSGFILHSSYVIFLLLDILERLAPGSSQQLTLAGNPQSHFRLRFFPYTDFFTRCP
jgi:hypothetical protein